MSTNNERLNVGLVDMLRDKSVLPDVRVKKAKYMIALGADVNAKVAGKSVLSWVLKDDNTAIEVIDFLKENGVEEFEISKSEVDALALNFWDENGKIKSMQEIKSLVRNGANLGVRNKYTYAGKVIWKNLSLQEMNEILKMLPKGFEIEGDVSLFRRGLTELPDFSKVKVMGDFNCADNQLTTLKGAPSTVGGDFWCDRNNLTSLEYGPKEVAKEFYCRFNKLTTLKGAPREVGKSFYCFENQLVSLIGGPEKIGEDFNCSKNKLRSLEGGPLTVGRDFNCEGNLLVSLDGKSEKIGGVFRVEEEVKAKLEEKKNGEQVGGLSGIFKNIFSRDRR